MSRPKKGTTTNSCIPQNPLQHNTSLCTVTCRGLCSGVKGTSVYSKTLTTTHGLDDAMSVHTDELLQNRPRPREETPGVVVVLTILNFTFEGLNVHNLSLPHSTLWAVSR